MLFGSLSAILYIRDYLSGDRSLLTEIVGLANDSHFTSKVVVRRLLQEDQLIRRRAEQSTSTSFSAYTFIQSLTQLHLSMFYLHRIVDIGQGPKGTQLHHVTLSSHRPSCTVNALEVDYPPRPAQDKTSQLLSHSSDPSMALFTLYLRISEQHDRRKYKLFKSEID